MQGFSICAGRIVLGSFARSPGSLPRAVFHVGTSLYIVWVKQHVQHHQDDKVLFLLDMYQEVRALF